MAYLNLFITALLIIITTAQSYRLPTTCRPNNYDVDLELPSDIFATENATAYTGTVGVNFTVSENVTQVVLHASATYLNVTSVTIASATNVTYNVTGYSVNSTTDILTVELNSTLVINETYQLVLHFEGQVSIANLYGIYKSNYTDSTNTTYYLVTTQMEPTHARKAFPCFDEPSYKATFSISLTYPTGLNVLGNSDVLSYSTSIDNSTATTVFKPTPEMSTYLVAFVVSNFTCTQGNPIEGTLVNQVCSRDETSSTREWALEVAPLVIHSLNSYLNINYSANMAKLDQVATIDFSFGAMENWGLITYRERALLYDANETSNSYKQSIASVIAHELAHQWFGNLVTCKWWSEIFLNEGFATFFEYFTTHELLPDYEMDKQFVTKTLQYIFEEDASSAEALQSSASTPSQISARFGGVTYDKGGSVLRMNEHILGTTAWKAGLNSYLKQFAHSSAEPDDLWTVLNASVTALSNLPTDSLSAVMSNWIKHPGYPVVTVSLTNGTLKFSQKRFVFRNTTTSNVTWYVPITFTTSQNTATFDVTTPMTWLTPDADLEVPLGGTLSWILVNNQQTGFYRVNYDDNLWTGLTTALLQTSFSNIPEINRAQIVNDAFNLARGGYIVYSKLFNISQFLKQETSYHVWHSAFGGFEFLLKRFGENSPLGSAISNHCLNLSSALIASVPLTATNDSNHIYTLKQVLAQTWACRLGDSNCKSSALQLFASYKNTSVRPNKNLRAIIYGYGLKYSTNISSDWEFLWNAYLSTSLSTEQVTILASLGSTTDENNLKLFLNKTLTNNSGIRSQDYAAVFSAVYTGSSVGVDVALDFFIEYYNTIVTRYTSINSVGNILKGISERITTDAQIIKLRNFISTNALSETLLEAANAALTTAQNNNLWVSTYKSQLYLYYGLEETTTSTSTTTTTASTPTTTPCKCSADTAHIALSLVVLALLVFKF